jgi:hypothetical protein
MYKVKYKIEQVAVVAKGAEVIVVEEREEHKVQHQPG